MMKARSYRYHLPKKAVKGNCPCCGHQYRKTLSRYVDAHTGEALPPQYGRCDRESNCGYHLNPYHKEVSGICYADQQRLGYQYVPKEWFKIGWRVRRNGVSRQNFIQHLIETQGATLEQAERVAAYSYDKNQESKIAITTPSPKHQVYSIPDELFQQSLSHYHNNQFACLLQHHFGVDIATKLLYRFQVGTSSRWLGACIFWYIDEQNRKRGGQIKLFDNTFHTIKYVDSKGEKRSKISWVHAALIREYNDKRRPIPDWLSYYQTYAQRSPCLFGLTQLIESPTDQPVAIVEAPKTAIICTPYFPEFIWLAVGSLSYLNPQRLAPLQNRTVLLFPDLSHNGSAFISWTRVAQDLNRKGFAIAVSDYLEMRATIDQRKAGLDLADYLLEQWAGYPPSWDL